MANYYQVFITDPFGVRLAVVPNYERLEYTRMVNNVGSLSLVLPPTYRPFIAAENRIEVWRSANGGPFYLETETVWIMRRPQNDLANSGEYSLTVVAFDANTLLKRRNVLYYAGSAQSTKTASADNMMKAIMRENFGSSLSGRIGDTTGVDISAYLSVQTDLGLAPSLTKSFPWREVLTVFQELAQASFVAGTYLAFDVVYNGSNFEFRTYTGQRGVDHRFPSGQNPIILDPALGNLGNVSLIEDYTEEKNAVYAGGQGEGTNRVVKYSVDSTRISISPVGRIEDFTDSRNSDDPTSIQAEADAVLRASRPKIIFDGAIIENPATRYGLQYGFGDQVTAQYLGRAIDCRIEGVHVTVADDKETIDVKLQSVT